MKEITITIRTVMEMIIGTHDLILRMTIYHLSSALLTTAQLGYVMIVLIVMDAALILIRKVLLKQKTKRYSKSIYLVGAGTPDYSSSLDGKSSSWKISDDRLMKTLRCLQFVAKSDYVELLTSSRADVQEQISL